MLIKIVLSISQSSNIVILVQETLCIRKTMLNACNTDGPPSHIFGNCHKKVLWPLVVWLHWIVVAVDTFSPMRMHWAECIKATVLSGWYLLARKQGDRWIVDCGRSISVSYQKMTAVDRRSTAIIIECILSYLTTPFFIAPKIWAYWFLPRDAMHKRGYCRHAVSVRLSVWHVRELRQNE